MSCWGLQTELYTSIKFQVNSDISVKIVEGSMCSPMGSGMYLLEISVFRVEDAFFTEFRWLASAFFLLLARTPGMCTIWSLLEKTL